ncbi:MAG: phosphoribosylaminoimidazolesuccinocarboxamide synthase [Desulfovibrio sp.]|nr:phosphoribosylaminoimidazolesuccinocarboxamide synthase [Desulfovibrio sp.]
MKVVTKTDITAYPLRSRGKVRDIYEIDADTLLIVTTDRMSAFDVIMAEPIPYKGVILNKLTLYWMRKFEDIVPNHILESDVDRFPAALAPWKDELEGRAVIVRKAEPLPVECIVRGYITGSGLKNYETTGMICGHKLPAGLREADKLEPALFCPSTKAELGQHDENITLAQAAALLGDETARKVSSLSLELYNAGSAHAARRGIIVADTKFEFGFINGTLHLIDEVLTPDSSRFWPAASYAPGKVQPSFDKQYLRNWLSAQPWNKEPPPPTLPQDVIDATAKRYQEAYDILTK